jgi:hypothetical protein
MRCLKGLVIGSLAVGTFLVGAGLGMQPGASLAKPYHNGSVWDIQYIRVKPGMDEAYKAYLSGQWKTMHDAFKKEGLILSYKVIESEGHSPNDFNLMLMTEYKDLASMEASEDKFTALERRSWAIRQSSSRGTRTALRSGRSSAGGWRARSFWSRRSRPSRTV